MLGRGKMNRKGSWLWLVGVLCGVWFTAASVVPAEEPLRVKEKLNKVEKNNGIDFNDEQATQPGTVDVSKDQKYLTLTKTFKPPNDKWKFKPFDKTTIHVDIWKSPESTSLDRVIDNELEVQIRGVFHMPKNVGTYPLRGEGNLQPPASGGGGGPATDTEWHWAAMVLDAKVDLAICNGQSGAEVPEDKEESVGAFTVANLNNTDGDGKVDNVDDEVKATANGRDEVDLMRLILRKPEPDLGGKVTLKIVSGKVTLWKLPTKPKASEEKDREFDTSKLPLELWVEATDVSAKVRDIEIQMEYKGIMDTVRATAVWAEVTSVLHDKGDDFSKFSDLTTPPNNWFADSQLGNHIGLRPIDDKGIRNVILIQYTVLPNGIERCFSVKFDISRRRHEIAKLTDSYGQDYENAFVFSEMHEEPNDDGIEYDESTAPTSEGHLYVIDAPGLNELRVDWEKFSLRSTFQEFMRVSFDGDAPAGNQLLGSICSSYFDWNSFLTIRRDASKRPSWFRCNVEGKEEHAEGGVNQIGPTEE
jgi:hypothetical protein